MYEILILILYWTLWMTASLLRPRLSWQMTQLSTACLPGTTWRGITLAGIRDLSCAPRPWQGWAGYSPKGCTRTSSLNGQLMTRWIEGWVGCDDVIIWRKVVIEIRWISINHSPYPHLTFWTSKFADWDMWMRLPMVQQGRECLVPEVSRTFHFGSTGAHLTGYFHANFYAHTSFNTLHHVTLADLDKYVWCATGESLWPIRAQWWLNTQSDDHTIISNSLKLIIRLRISQSVVCYPSTTLS